MSLSNADGEKDAENDPRPASNSTADNPEEHVQKHNHVTPDQPIFTSSNPVNINITSPASQPVANGHSRQPLSPSVELQTGLPFTKSISNGFSTSTDLKKDSIEEQLEYLKDALSKTSTEAAQRLLRQNWRVFLFDNYSEEHLSYVMRAGLKNCHPQTVERIFRDEGVMRGCQLRTLAKKNSMITTVLENATLDNLLDYVPEDVLDNAVLERLKSVSAKELVKWLAEADRLGYKLDDILDITDESVRPNLPNYSETISQDNEDRDVTMSNTAPRPPLDLALPFRDVLLEEQERNAQADRMPPKGSLSCPTCHAQFGSMSGYTHHVTKKACSKPVPDHGFQFWCYNCRQGFTTRQGQEYHRLRDVCNAPKDAQGNLLDFNYVTVNQPSAAGPPVNFTAPPQNQNPIYAQAQAQVQVQAPPLLPPLQNAALPQVQQLGPSPQNFGSSIQLQSYSTPFSTPPAPRPLDTPRNSGSEKVVPGRRLSPSDLTPLQLADMNAKLAAAEAKYEADIAAIPATSTSSERDRRMTTLKQGHATRKSMIRKSFGVSLRVRARQRAAQEDTNAVATPTPSQATARLESYRAPPSSQIAARPDPSGIPSPVPVVSGFSPINAPVRNITPRSGPMNQSSSTQQQQQQQPFRRSPLVSNITPLPSPLETKNADYKQLRKRRRTSQDGNYAQPQYERPLSSQFQPTNFHHSGPPRPPATLSQEVRLEDSAMAMQPAKKVPIKNAQARWEALQPKNNKVPSSAYPGSSGAGTGDVIVLSSSESGGDDERRAGVAQNSANRAQLATSTTQNAAAQSTSPSSAAETATSAKQDSSVPPTTTTTNNETNLANPTKSADSKSSPSPNITNGTLPSQPTSRPVSRPTSSGNASPAMSAGTRGQAPGSRPQSSSSGSGRPIGGFMARRGGFGAGGN